MIINRNEEIENTSGTKGLLMLLIVLYHSCVFWTGTWFTKNPEQQSYFLNNLALWLNSFHVYAFFIVSGYIYHYTKHERQKYKSFSLFLKKKISRLIIPYMFFAITWVIPISVVYNKFTSKEIIVRYFLGVSPNQLWYLLALFIIFVFSYACSNWWINHPAYTAIVFLALYFGGILLEGKVSNYLQIISVFRCYLFFYIGFLLRDKKHDFIYKIKPVFYLLASVGLFLFLKYILLYKNTILVHPVELLLRVVGSVGAFAVFQRITVKLKHSVAFNCLCDKSMIIYLVHQQFVYISISIMNGLIHPLLIAVFSFFFSLICSYIVSILLSRFKITRMLIGG